MVTLTDQQYFAMHNALLHIACGRQIGYSQYSRVMMMQMAREALIAAGDESTGWGMAITHKNGRAARPVTPEEKCP